jgi:hypothetical protein
MSLFQIILKCFFELIERWAGQDIKHLVADATLFDFICFWFHTVV